MTPWLTGRRALIAGEGAAIDVVVAALQSAGAKAVRSSIVPGGDDGIAAEMAALFEAGGVDILIHGGTRVTTLAAVETGSDAWRDGVSADIDLRFLQSTEFVRRCLVAGQGGSILFLMPAALPQATGYIAAATVTGAIGNLVKSLAVEWARDGIRINAIATRVHHAGAADNDAPLASLGHLATYILSDYGAYISGAVMGVDET